MELFDSLFEEHKLIARTIDALEVYIDRIDERRDVNQHDLQRFVTFFREFADLVHQEREESILFPALARHGFAEDVGPIAHVRAEHEKERGLICELMRAANQRDPWSAGETKKIAKLVRSFIAFQRAHVEKENDLLYPAAEKEIKGEGPGLLAREAREFDEDRARFGHCDWLRALAEELASDYPADDEA